MKCFVYSFAAFSFLHRRVLFTPLYLLVLFLGCVVSRNVDAVTNINASTTVLPVLDIDLGNQSSAEDIVKRPEKRSSAALLPLPSSSSVILKDDDVSAMDRIEVPIIYHTGPHLGKNYIPYNHKPDYNHQNFIINPGLKPLYNSLSDQGPQVFPPQGAASNFPHLQQASFSSFAPASFNFPYATLSNHPGATNNHPVFRNSAASQSDSFDKLCPASKPYPVYIEKKVPVTVEKRVPYPVKVPYPVHHYHYDNIKHRNIAAPPGYEPGKTPPPSPPPDDEDAPIKESDDRVVKGVGGLFQGGDSGGFKGDTKEELYEMSEEDPDEDDYESYDGGRYDPPPPPPKPSNYRNDRRPPRPSPRSQQQRGREVARGRDFSKRNPKPAGPEGGFSRNANVKTPLPPSLPPVPQQLKLSTRKPRQGVRTPGTETMQTPIRRHDEDMDQLEEIKIQATTPSPEELLLLPKLQRPGSSTLLETNIETNTTSTNDNDNNKKPEK
ncbi:hypothetical protein LSTR_LSTR006314 [Laodelphax striatellus]|uniref:Uncharacterized protein n=1 Tax=Laodelphax striatellus TaxID=195883 RepID=A0A482XQH9_LAOST|nr:hypothetical protein LSTR_LSTR006314 [Laodelphax striatellus]